MKLNKKGYMLVEIIVSFALTFAILITLTNLVIHFKNTNEDFYYSTKYIKDKNLITRNIMEDLESINIIEVNKISSTSNEVKIDFTLEDSNIRRLEILKTADGKIRIQYGNITGNEFDKNHYSHYEKKLESSLNVNINAITLTNSLKYATIKIPITSLYSDDNYDINLFVEKTTNI